MDLMSILSLSEKTYNDIDKNQQRNNNKSQSQSLRSTKKIKRFAQHDLFVLAVQQNFDCIFQYLETEQEVLHMKLLCKSIQYMFIVREMWTGLKLQVAEKKLEDFDDYEFVEQEPKQISKEDKKIRIHSLKKSIICGLLCLDNFSSKKPSSKREASNIKLKTANLKMMNDINPSFQRTQIGFKRLLPKTNHSSRQSTKQSLMSNSSLNMKTETETELRMGKSVTSFIDFQQSSQLSIERLPDLLTIPAEYTIDDLMISPKDQWVKNIHRANNLITVVSKWNNFHNRFWTAIQKQSTPQDTLGLLKKIIKVDGCLLAYKNIFQEEPHISISTSILQGASKNLLIQDKLNKIGKSFSQNHKELQQLITSKDTQKVITGLHNLYQKKSLNNKLNKNSLSHSAWIEYLGVIDESIDQIYNKINHQALKKCIGLSLVSVFKESVEELLAKSIEFAVEQTSSIAVQAQTEQLLLKNTYMRHLTEKPQYFQLIFHILYGVYSKLTLIARNKHSNTKEQSSASTTTKLQKKNNSPLNISTIQQSSNSMVGNKKLLSSLKASGTPAGKGRQIATTVTTSDDKLLLRNDGNQVYQGLKEQHSIWGILWNISKYFNKLQKQLVFKERKKKDQAKIALIRHFLKQEANSLGNLPLTKKQNIKHLQTYYQGFKAKIEQLKAQINKAS